MPLLPTVERETAADPRYSVIWLHGLGADGNDFAPIVPELVAHRLAGAAFRVSARAGAAGDRERRCADARLVRHPSASTWSAGRTKPACARRSPPWKR